MAILIAGTTPTITIAFSTIDTDDIVEAYLCVKYGGTNLIEKDLDDATVATGSVAWKLTQAETLAMPLGSSVMVMCDWKLDDGTRGRSKVVRCVVEESGKEEVI